MPGPGWERAQGHGGKQDHLQLGLLAVQETPPACGGRDSLESRKGADSASDESGQSDSGGSDSTATSSSGELVITRGVSSSEDPPLDAGGRAALLALAVVFFAGPVVVGLCRTRPCWVSSQSLGHGFGRKGQWSRNWPCFMVSLHASLAFAGWCVFVRRRALPHVRLHTWTLRFGAVSGTYAAAILAYPMMDVGCHGWYGAAWGAACLLVLMASWIGCTLIPYHLLSLKLRGLGHLRAARVVSASILVGAGACATWLAVAITETLLEESKIAALRRLSEASFMLLFAPVVASCFGAWVMLANAVRAARSRRRLSVQMARWELLAAGLVLASSLLTFAEFSSNSWAKESRMPEWWTSKWAFFYAANNVVSCLSVAILSGLSGSKSQRQMAVMAFEMINSYCDYELQAYYEEFLAYLDDAQVRWVRVRYLLQLARSRKAMVRCQDVPPNEVVVGSKGFPRAREDCKHRFVVSHPWLRPEHPDSEDGLKLDRLVEQLALLHAEDDDAVFIDFMSLPQHDKLHPDFQSLLRQREQSPDFQHPALRTPEEDKIFKKALHQMELLYSMSSTPVIVLPMDDVVTEGAEYLSRGWCFFEFALAFNFHNLAIANAGSVEDLRGRMINGRCDTLEEFLEQFGKTHFTDKGDSKLVRDLFHQTLNRPLPDSVVERHPSDALIPRRISGALIPRRISG